MRAGWYTTSLGEVCEVLTGPFGTLLHKSDYIADGIPLINPINVVDGRIVVGTEKTVSQKTFDRLRNYVLTEGDIVFGRRGEIGRCAVIGPEQAGWLCGTGCFFIKRSTLVDSRFLAALLGAPPYRQRLEAAATGTTMKNLSNQALQNLSVSLPPLPEQQRIVAILDETFAGLAIATANAEKNLRNARELFESYLSSVFEGAFEQWPTARLGELSQQVTDGTHNSPPYTKGGIPMLDSKHIREDFAIEDNTSEKFISRETDTLLAQRCKPREGDILISSRGTIGKIAIVNASQDFNIMGNMILIRLPASVDRQFAAFYLHSQVAHIESIARGVAQKGLYLSQVREYEIPIPPLSKQSEIGKSLGIVSEQTKRTEAIYTQKLAALADLKQSILQKAFSGELTSPPSQAIQEAAE